MNKHSTEIAASVGKAWCFQRAQKLAAKGLLIALAALMLAGVLQTANALVLGPAFTYHGRLQSDAVPVSGTYDLTFSLYTNGTGGTAVEGPLTNSAVAVNNGVFTVRLDFGVGVFDGTAYWLEIGVRTNGDGAFTILSPRQELLATPYAVYAENARAEGLDGIIPEAALKGTYGHAMNFTNPGNAFVGDGSELTGVDALTVGGLAASNFWKTRGNAGTSPTNGNFVGTTDNSKLELRVNKTRALVLEPDSRGLNTANLIGGHANNAVQQPGSGGDFIGGGGFATGPNLIYSNSSGVFIGAGSVNQVGPSVNDAVLGGGYGNIIQAPDSVVGGGVSNWVTSLAQYSFVGGGLSNTNGGWAAAVGGGSGNFALAAYSTVAGGSGNSAAANSSTVGGGSGNLSGSGIAGGTTVAGGINNIATGGGSTVGGGQGNIASGDSATVGGGAGNTASALLGNATVAGGNGNTASGFSSTVPGGFFNSAAGDFSFAAGQHAQANRTGSFVWGDGSQDPFKGAAADDAFSVLASGGVFFYNGTNGLHVDGLANNDGNLDFGLRFGGALQSGEGIASKRTSGGNQFGLDFYTSSANRLSIDKFGNVGIGTNKPQAQLEVNGTEVLVDGSGGEEAILAGSLGEVYVGSLNPTVTAINFFNFGSFTPMHIYCSSITIEGGADLAEPFPIADEGKQIPQGSVVVIDDQNPGQLKVSSQPYDSRVAGVLSGANGINPGIQMQQQGLLEGGKNVALTGRVYVQADASNGPIKPGDLLTTASTPGHAMRVTDHLKAQGAILGKAMTGLDNGKGMVLVLVTLQ